jgi:amidase
MSFGEYGAYDGLGLAGLVTQGQVTPSELMEEAIARAEALNPKLNAVIYKAYESGRETAAGTLPQGPFRGVPFLLKDISALAKGMPTRQGSRFFPAFPADHDSFLTARFRKAGLVIFGKTNAPEFGLLPTTEGKLYGPARNPWTLDRSTGGSSGGAAAAVAAGIVPLAHANDGGGSIRIPASCCGLVGLKPSRGRVSAGPDMGETVDGLAVDLAVSRTVRDTAAALDAVAGSEPGDPYGAPPAPASYVEACKTAPGRLRIGYSLKQPGGGALHPDCIAAVERAAKLCADLGHEVEEAAPDFDIAFVLPAFAAIWCGNLAAIVDFVAKLTGQTPSPQTLEGLTYGFYEAGMRVNAAQYLQSKLRLNQIARIAGRFHQTHDLWLTPTLGTPPVKLGTIDIDETDADKAFAALLDYVPFTPFQNVTGQPAINLPLHWNDEGLPIGVQFVAAYGGELTLLQLATQLEQAQPWFDKYATLAL